MKIKKTPRRKIIKKNKNKEEEVVLKKVDSIVDSIVLAKREANRCFKCNKKVSIFSTQLCRCNQRFCNEHRLMHDHACTFDIKKFNAELIAKNNPEIKKNKIGIFS